MHASVMAFGQRVLTAERVRGRHVLEVGAYDVNGSLRAHVLSLGPASYLGVDVRSGPGVDLVLGAEDLAALGRRFDLVIATEMLEHAPRWREALEGCKRAVAAGGLLLLTTRSLGFPRHEAPEDHWRFSPDFLRAAMTGFRIVELEPDPEAPGVFVLARRGRGTLRIPPGLAPEPAP